MVYRKDATGSVNLGSSVRDLVGSECASIDLELDFGKVCNVMVPSHAKKGGWWREG